MSFYIQKLRALSSRRSKAPSKNSASATQNSDTQCHLIEPAELPFEHADPTFGSCKNPDMILCSYESTQLSKDGFTFNAGTGSESAPCIPGSNGKRKSIRFTETINLSDSSSKSKKRMSLRVSGSGGAASPNIFLPTSWLDESDTAYIDPREIQSLLKEPASPKTGDGFFTVVLNPRDNVSRSESKESARVQAQSGLHDDFVLINEESHNSADVEETEYRELNPFGMMKEEQWMASDVVLEKRATQRLEEVLSSENMPSTSTNYESRNCSIMPEDYASNFSFSEPSTMEDSIPSLLAPMDDSEFKFDFFIDPPIKDSHFASEWSYPERNPSCDIDGLPIGLFLTNDDMGFDSAEFKFLDDSFLSTTNYKDSLFGKCNLPKSEPKRPQPRYSCPLCHKYDGSRAFTRKDHLQQHLLTFHSVPKEELIPSFCPYSDCPESAANATSKVFKTIVEYRRHLLTVHGASMFECKIPGCSRVGKYGFARETNLKKHIERHHPRGEKYAEVGRGSYFWRDPIDLK